MNRKIALPCLAAATLAAFVLAFNTAREQRQTPREMMLAELDRIDRAVVETIDGMEKQRMTEAIPVSYEDMEGNLAATYYICKTTYYAADPASVTGLDIDAIVGVIDPNEAESERLCKVNDMAAALYEKAGLYYLCWTDTPEYSFVFKYDPAFITDDEVMRMAESVYRVAE